MDQDNIRLDPTCFFTDTTAPTAPSYFLGPLTQRGGTASPLSAFQLDTMFASMFAYVADDQPGEVVTEGEKLHPPKTKSRSLADASFDEQADDGRDPPEEERGMGSSSWASASFSDDETVDAASRSYDARVDKEVDYDTHCTALYRSIEAKEFQRASSRADSHPAEASAWVVRKETKRTGTVRKGDVRWRLLPIHATCIFRAPLSLIDDLLMAYPDGARRRDDEGMLPIHLAARNGASKGVVISLLKAHPHSLDERDAKGRTPLDFVELSQNANRHAVVKAIKKFKTERDKERKERREKKVKEMKKLKKEEKKKMEKEAAAAKKEVAVAKKEAKKTTSTPPTDAKLAKTAQSSLPNSPLEVSLSSSSHTGEVGKAGKADKVVRQGSPLPSTSASSPSVPVEVEVDYSNRTQLFRLVLKKDWNGVARRATKQPSEASTWIVTKGLNGNLRFLPLHKACCLSPPASVVKTLLKAHPGAATATDQDGWHPLHCACYYGAGEGTVKALLDAYPKAAMARDDEGRTPLHYGCLRTGTPEIVRSLLASNAAAATARDAEGRLPLHHAASKGAPLSIIDALLDAFPRAAASRDDQGRTALHHACRKGGDVTVIRSLLRAHSAAAASRDDQDWLAIHYACQGRGDGGGKDSSGGGSSDPRGGREWAAENAAVNAGAVVRALLEAAPGTARMVSGGGRTPLVEARLAPGPAGLALTAAMEEFLGRHPDQEATESEAVLKQRVAALETALKGMGSAAAALRDELDGNGAGATGGLGQGTNKIPIRKKAGSKMKLRMLKGGKRTDPALREVMGRMAELADGVGLGRGGGGASSPSQDERREP